MFNSSWLALASIFFVVPAAFADARCPGKVASVHAQHVAQYLNVVPVTLNRSGSYPFLVDTGAQITAIDPALAAELHLRGDGTGALIGVAAQQRILLAELEDLQVGEQHMSDLQVAIQPLDTLRSEIPGIRGVLGGDFLRHFDVLIDQANSLLCLDTAGKMRNSVHGERISLASTPAGSGAASIEPLVIPVSLSEMPERPLLLLLDSAANVPFLWKAPDILPTDASIVKGISAGRAATSEFSRLPPQDMRIGKLLVHHVIFAILMTGAKDGPRIQGDGLMPIAQFRRIYIDCGQRYVVLEPW